MSAPAMRNLVNNRLKRDFIISVGLAVALTAAAKILHNNKRKANYANFYENYDMKADYNRMKKAGVFTSVAPDGSVTGEGW